MADGHGLSVNRTTAQIDVSEVYFLVLKWLSSGPCKTAAEALLQDAVQQGLLPRRYDIHGGSQAASYQSLQQQYSSTPADALLQLLQQVLAKVQAGGHAGAQGLQTLLAEGPLAALPALATRQQPPLAPWLVNPARAAALPQRLLLQQAGLARGTDSCSLPQQLMRERYCHHATFRGHGFPVFALMFDKAGQRVVTGADDANVKIWSLTTGLLLVTGRGHTGEISDLSLSADGSMVASGSVDNDVRIWSMQDENLGQNMAVLRGHTAPVTLIDFHPTIPSALLSASNDGTLRLWDARDQHFAPLLLVPSESFGAFSAVLGRTGTPAAAAAAAAEGGPSAAAAAAAVAGMPAQAAAAAGSEQQDSKGVLWCSWSPDGSSIVAGSQDCCTYIWYWDVCKHQQQHRYHPSSSSSSVVVGAAAAAVQTDDVKQSQQPCDPQPAQQPGETASNPFATFRRQLEQKLEQMRQERQLQRRRSRRISSSSAQPQQQQQQQQDQEQPNPQQQQQQQQPAQSAAQPQQQQQQQADVHMQAGVSHSQQQQQQQQCLASADWPVPIELQRLAGHKNEVLHVEFSHSGSMLASASLDGSVRLWQQVRRAGRLRLAWEESCCPLMVVAAPTAAATSSKSKPRRQQATTLVINWLVWACDDSQVLAAASDNNIRVWCPHTGTLLRLLSGHSQQAHVLQMHPLNPHLAMSAGYDGQIILWDTAQGSIIKQFSSSDTLPLARGSWAQPVIQLCDGQFSPDGNSFIVADVAGQFSIYAMGTPPPLLLSAPYDQFFKKDYDGIMHDEAGFAAYLEPAAVPTYFLAKQQPLCDNQFKPYPDDFQEAYRAGRVLEYVKAGGGGMSMRGSSMELPPSLVTWPPTVTAAAWKALEDRAAAAARQTRVASEETVRDTAERQALLEHSRLLAALARGMTLQEEEQRIQQLAVAAANRQRQLNHLPQQQRQGQQDASVLVARAAAAVGMADFVVLSDDYEEHEREVEDAAELAGSDSDYAEQAATDDSDWDDASDLEDEFDDDFDSGASEGRRQRQQQQAQRHSERQRQRRQRRAAAASEADGMVLRSGRGAAAAATAEHDDDDWRLGRNRRRARGRHATPSERSTPQRPRRISKRRRNSDEFDYNQVDTDSELQDLDEDATQQGVETRALQQPAAAAAATAPVAAAAAAGASERARRLQRRSVRQRTEAAAAMQGQSAAHTDYTEQQRQHHQQQEQAAGTAQDPEQHQHPDVAAAADAAAGQHHSQVTSQAQRRAAGGAQHRDASAAAATAAVATSLRRMNSGGGSCRPGRPYSCYAWLSGAAHNPNTYVPQLGDAVVYLWEGHQKHLDAISDRLTQRPWEILGRAGPALQQLQWMLQLQVQQQQWHWPQQWQQQADMQYYAGLSIQEQGQQNQQIQPGLQQLQQQFEQLHQLSQQQQLGAEAAAAAAAAPVSVADPAALGFATGQCDERTASVLPAAAEAAMRTPGASSAEGTAAAAVAGQLAAAQQVGVTAADAAAAGHAQQAEVTGATASAGHSQSFGNVQVEQTVAQDAAQMQLSLGFSVASLTPTAEPYSMRPAEACTIVGLEYCIQDDQTVAVLTLQLTDAALAPAAAAVGPAAIEIAGSSVTGGDQQKQQQGQQGLQTPGPYFQVVLPPPSSGHAEFLILQSRFEASVQQQWQIGDRVQNYQLEADHSEGGQWYVGTVVEDQRIARPNAEVTADPYGCGGLWERYRVRWDAEKDDEATELSHQPSCATAAAAAAAAMARGASSPAAAEAAAVVRTCENDNSNAADEADDASWLSPWELYAADLSTEAVLAVEHSTQLTGEQVAVLLHALEQLTTRGKYRMFRAAPAPHDIYDTAEGRHAYNRVVALPLGLEHIQERLVHGYYRSMQAVLHDAFFIARNAATFNGADSPLAAKAQELCEFIQAAAAAGANAPDLSHWLADKKEIAAAAAAAAAGLSWDGVEQQQHHHHQQQQNTPEARSRSRFSRQEEVAAAAADMRQKQKQMTTQRSRRSAAQKAIRQFASGYDEFDGVSDLSDEDSQHSYDEEQDDVSGRRAGAARSRQAQRSSRQRSQQQQQRRPQRQQQQRHRKQRAYREDYSTPETSEAELSDPQPTRRSSRLRKGQQQHVSHADDAAGEQTAAAAWLQNDVAALDMVAWQQQQYQGEQWPAEQQQQLFNQQEHLACVYSGQVQTQQNGSEMSQQQLDAAADAALGIPAAAQAALAAAAATDLDQVRAAEPAAGLLGSAAHAAEATAAATGAARPKLKLKMFRHAQHS